MLECCDILQYIDELLYEIIDCNNNIIYPKNDKEIKIFEDIISNHEPNHVIYYPQNDRWYKYHIKDIEKENKKYQLKYLLDITNIKKAEEKYQIDSLTSVLTRPTILEKLNQELPKCIENNIPFSIIMGDIDYFKSINDSYGHIAGDKVLRGIGNILLEQKSADLNLVGRYGGEEFLFFFKNINLEKTINIITQIKTSLDKLVIPYENTNIENITMSFGVYHFTNLQTINNIKDNQKLIIDLINKADIALYESKKSGRNQTHVYSEGFINKVDYK